MTVSEPHITDDEMLLDFYNESPSADRAVRRAHLETCEACRALDREMRAVLALVDTAPTIEAPPGFAPLLGFHEAVLLPLRELARSIDAHADLDQMHRHVGGNLASRAQASTGCDATSCMKARTSAPSPSGA